MIGYKAFDKHLQCRGFQLKTKELMIGDWVYDKEKKKYGRVDKLEHDVEDESVEPIPLNAEILEKNGLTQGEFHKMQSFSVVVHDCSVLKMENLLEIFQGGTYVIRLFVKYVHELQHALRLCKIDKEIEL